MVTLAFFIPKFIERHYIEQSKIDYSRPDGEIDLSSSNANIALYCDFIRETAISFGVKNVVVVGNITPVHKLFRSTEIKFVFTKRYQDVPGTKIVLSNIDGVNMNEYKFPDNFTLVIGSDDGLMPADIEGDRVKIETPVDYPLWSAVAAGIVLNHALS